MTTLALSERETADLELRHKKSDISIKYTVPHKETHCDGALWRGDTASLPCEIQQGAAGFAGLFIQIIPS